MINGWGSDIANRNETEDLMTVKLHDTKVNIEEDISISQQSVGDYGHIQNYGFSKCTYFQLR